MTRLRSVLGTLAAVGVGAAGLLLAGGSLATTSPGPAADPGSSCVPTSGNPKVLAHDGRADVYSTGGNVYGCSWQTGRRTLLGSTRSCVRADLIGPVAVAGVLAAYSSEACGVDTGNTTVVVRRLTDGHVLRDQAATTGVKRPESYEAVGSLVLKSDGSIAWIASWQSLASIGTKPAVEVHRLQHGQAALLDSGTTIATRSLALHGSRLSWKHGRQTRSSTLS